MIYSVLCIQKQVTHIHYIHIQAGKLIFSVEPLGTGPADCWVNMAPSWLQFLFSLRGNNRRMWMFCRQTERNTEMAADPTKQPQVATERENMSTYKKPWSNTSCCTAGFSFYTSGRKVSTKHLNLSILHLHFIT